MPTIRVELALESLAENESVTAAANDQAADALLRWAEDQIVQFDAPDVSDDAFAQRVEAVKAAVRAAARSSAGRDIAQVVASADDALLRSGAAPRSIDAGSGEAEAGAPAMAEVHTAPASAANENAISEETPPTRGWHNWRRRLRRWLQLEVRR